MKIALLASGGVDSSVSLALLKNQGHDVTAFYLKIWLEDELTYLGSCPWEDDLEYVKTITKKYSTPLEVISFQREYWDEVVSYALNEIKLGNTPNSDLLCNNKIKFGKFIEKIPQNFTLVASGHYARTEIVDGKTWLKKAKDPKKDQTYFLAGLNQSQLSKALFPIGSYLKSEVRDLAKLFNLPNQSRKDSQGICFLGKLKFPEFIKAHFGTKQGALVEFETQTQLGEHQGYWFFTIGQRHGIKLHGGPWYVVKKDINKNIVYISKNYRSSFLEQRDHFFVQKFNWLTTPPTPTQRQNLQVKVRHGETLYNCKLSEPIPNFFKVSINGVDQGFAPGQFAVFYSGDFCLGSATITSPP